MVLNGKPVRKAYYKRLKEMRMALGNAPKLAVFSDGKPDSEIYRRAILNLAKRLEVEIVYSIDECDGVVFLGRRAEYDIPHEKDIEGLSPYHLGRLVHDRPLYLPPTPAAALEILKYYGYTLRGKEVVVVGRSFRVGRPLSIMLLNEDATVCVLHTRTRDVKFHTRRADVVFLSTGSGRAFGRDYFSEKSVVVDISTVYRDGKVVGDAVFEDLKDYVRAITPVPGGVGRVTPLVLFDNLFKAAALRGR